MARNTQLSAAIINAQAVLLGDALDNGYLRIYDGSQPESPDTAITDQVLLAEFRFADPAASASPVAGVLTFDALGTAAALASGAATWYRALSEDGTTAVLDGTVGTEEDDANLTMLNVSIASGATLVINELAHAVRGSQPGL